MSFITKLFHKSHPKPQSEQDSNGTIAPSPETQPQGSSKEHYSPDNPAPSNASAANTRSNLQNGGMAVGFIAASDSPGGTDPTMGMVEGLVAGNMIAQRIQQHKKHEYWRGQEERFQAGDKDAVLAAPVEGGRERSRNREGRDERRKKRWERRAKRKGGEEAAGDAESGSSSDEGKK
jgi:hypothetical protein